MNSVLAWLLLDLPTKRHLVPLEFFDPENSHKFKDFPQLYIGAVARFRSGLSLSVLELFVVSSWFQVVVAHLAMNLWPELVFILWWTDINIKASITFYKILWPLQPTWLPLQTPGSFKQWCLSGILILRRTFSWGSLVNKCWFWGLDDNNHHWMAP